MSKKAEGGLTAEQIEEWLATKAADDHVSYEVAQLAKRALRSLEPDIEPYAWVIPGDDTADMNGWIACRINSEGEFTKPPRYREVGRER